MNVMVSLPLGLSAAAFACVIQKIDDVAFWAKYPEIALGLGISVMLPAVMGGWYALEEKHEYGLFRFMAWAVSTFIACLTLFYFFRTFSDFLARGFAWGLASAMALHWAARRAERRYSAAVAARK